MKKELVLGKDLKIRTYPQYAFIDAISNNECTNGDKLCRINIKNNTYKWIYDQLNAKKEIIDDDIVIYRNGLGVDNTGGFYCTCQDFFEIEFCIPFMQFSNIWDDVAFFYTTGDVRFGDEILKSDYLFSVFCNKSLAVDVMGKQEFFQDNLFEIENYVYYRVKKNSNTMIAYGSYEKKEWFEINRITLPYLQKANVKIGFYIQLSNNQYYKCIANNFIQLKFDSSEGKALDYAYQMNRDYVNYSLHPLIKFSYERRNTVKNRGLWKYIVDAIDSGKYIQFWLDEYYIEGLNAYKKKNYNHESLVYGYDTKTKKVMLMAFRNGRPIYITVSVRSLEVAWDNAYVNNRMVYCFEFMPRISEYDVDVEYILNTLSDYINSTNSLVKLGNTHEKDDGIFGLDIYNEIIEKENNQRLFLDDVRVSYLMKEHKECMLFRIEYLHACKIIEKNYSDIIKMLEEIVKKSRIIMGMVLKNRIVNDIHLQNRMWEDLAELSIKEKSCYQLIITELRDYLNLHGNTP